MSETQHPAESYSAIMGGLVEWLTEVYQERLSQAKEELVSAETVLGGLGYEERTERLDHDSTEHPTPQRSLARLASWFAEIERELEEHRRRILAQEWQSMAGEYALVSVQNLTEARQYLGLAQSALANLLVSLATSRLNAWEKQTRLYGVRLYLERVETAIVWAIESATNGLRQYHLDGGARLLPPPTAPSPAPPRVSTGAVSYKSAAPATPESTASPDAGSAQQPPAPASEPAVPVKVEKQPPIAENGGGFLKRLRRRKRPEG
ncbi:MAG TPA: hypothetical protein VF099_11840 [Ktedonobacterales bacterium]